MDLYDGHLMEIQFQASGAVRVVLGMGVGDGEELVVWVETFGGRGCANRSGWIRELRRHAKGRVKGIEALLESSQTNRRNQDVYLLL